MAWRRARSNNVVVRDQFSGVRTIAHGARSEVLVGADPLDGTPVVIKELDVSMLSRSAVRSLVASAPQLVAATQHPNLVTLHGVIEQNPGKLVFLEQYCPGSCDLLVDSTDATRTEQILAVGIRIAEGLTWLHAQGILHLDITPDHIRFPDSSTPCLADTGIGNLYPHRWRLSSGRIAEPACHLAPELIREQPASPATDVYSLASVLYELLSGTAPIPSFTGETPGGLCLRILNDQVQPLVAPGVPRVLSDLLATSLAKEPAARPVSADAFGKGLWQAVESLNSAWTGKLDIPEPKEVLSEQEAVVIWSPNTG